LVNKTEGNAPLIKVVRYIPPVVPSRFDSENDTPATGFHHFRSGSIYHHFQTFTGIVELELSLGSEVLSDSHRGMPLLMWVDSYDQVPLGHLLSFPGCSILYLR
jgi:hypothetical protein